MKLACAYQCDLEMYDESNFETCKVIASEDWKGMREDFKTASEIMEFKLDFTPKVCLCFLERSIINRKYAISDFS